MSPDTALDGPRPIWVWGWQALPWAGYVCVCASPPHRAHCPASPFPVPLLRIPPPPQGNELGAEGVRHVAEALKANSSLQQLDLSRVRSLGLCVQLF